MGTWGTGYFDNDHALDFITLLERDENPAEKISEAIETVLAYDYIDADDATAAIASAAIIDRQTNGTGYETEPDFVQNFPSLYPSLDLSGLKSKAVEALNIILGEESELNELWEENEELVSEWKTGIEDLIKRLSS